MQNKHALLIAPRLPEFDRESGSRRIFDLMQFLADAGWQVTFAAMTVDGGERYVKLLGQQGIEVVNTSDEGFRDRVAAGSFNLAYIAFWFVAEEFMPVIRELSPQTRVIVDSIDLQFLRESRGVFCDAGEGRRTPLLTPEYGVEFARELNTYAAADAVLTVSGKEASWLGDLLAGCTLARVVADNEDLPVSTVPFADRKGIVFIGNFWHSPNADAVRYLCREILPKVDKRLLAEHPVYIVGNALTEEICKYGAGLSNVKFVGWVPSVLPYLQRVRVAAIPLRYGAGTKRKIIQALMIGTPTVTTSIGAEGLGLEHAEHAMVADNAKAFARDLTHLLTDRDAWQSLAEKGREIVLNSHGREKVKTEFLEVVDATLALKPKPLIQLKLQTAGPVTDYDAIITRVHRVVREVVPSGSKLVVISKGDEELVKYEGITAAHYPQTPSGSYAGYYPQDSDTAVAELNNIDSADYLLIPDTSRWWLEHYSGLREHLETNGVKVWDDDSCIIYALSDAVAPRNETTPVLSAEFLEQKRPVSLVTTNGSKGGRKARPKVLVLGIYLAFTENNAEDTVEIIAGSKKFDVTQRWVSIGDEAPSERLAEVTVRTVRHKVPKFEILNDLIAEYGDLSAFEYVVISDDDVILPTGFIDEYLTLQKQLDFVLAQPARTNDSYLDHPIVEQQWGVAARQTRFVEIGPVFSFHRSIYDLVVPFDLTSPMGWGYENVWAFELMQRDLKMGIVDAVPVAHNIRKPVANYSWADANAGQQALLNKYEHLTHEECFRVLEIVAL